MTKSSNNKNIFQTHSNQFGCWEFCKFNKNNAKMPTASKAGWQNAHNTFFNTTKNKSLLTTSKSSRSENSFLELQILFTFDRQLFWCKSLFCKKFIVRLKLGKNMQVILVGCFLFCIRTKKAIDQFACNSTEEYGYIF